MAKKLNNSKKGTGSAPKGPSLREIRFGYFSAAVFTVLSIKCPTNIAVMVIVTALVFAASKMWLTHDRVNPLRAEMIVAVLLAGVTGEALWLGHIYHLTA